MSRERERHDPFLCTANDLNLNHLLGRLYTKYTQQQQQQMTKSNEAGSTVPDLGDLLGIPSEDSKVFDTDGDKWTDFRNHGVDGEDSKDGEDRWMIVEAIDLVMIFFLYE